MAKFLDSTGLTYFWGKIKATFAKKSELAGKQDTISDLATIRSGAALGATAVQTETDPVYSASAAATITSLDITNWNGKSNFSGSYNDLDDKPTIPDISGKENTSNKVTSLSSSSTDTQYPSAKCVYDMIGDIETILASI